MKLFAATVMSLSLLAVVSAQTNQTGAIARTGVATQTISVTRSSSQPPQMREVENFTGSVGTQPLA